MLYMVIVIIISLTVQDVERQESLEGFVSGIRANAVKGEVFYQRDDGKFNLESGHKLQEGDFIRTDSNSYAELLLQPGNYLRVGGQSELQILSDSHDKMRLKLNRGSINIEILEKDGEDSAYYWESLSHVYELTRIITPNAEVFITRPGIFRINSVNSERTDLIVRDGEAVINGRRVKGKRSGAASNHGVVIADIDSKLEDHFDAWSRGRADEQVDANKLLKNESSWSKDRKEGEETTVDLQDDDAQSKIRRLVISARPGAINFVEAGVEFLRPSKEWEQLTEKSHLETGDKLRTSAHTFAELTLLPDMNLRIDSKSEIQFEQLSNDGITVKLLKGSAILDVARFDSEELPQIAFGGASTSVVLADKGNYRIDSRSNGDEITIRDGKVFYKERSVGSCRKIVAGTVSDCDKKVNDSFDFWSEHRGEGTFYGRSMAAHLERLRRVRFKNTGFWFQNPGTTHYTFVPFSSSRFRSPYGGNYSTVLSPGRGPLIRPEYRPRPPFPSVPPIARPQP